MRYLRFGAPGQERPGVLDEDGYIRDVSGIVPDLSRTYLTDLPQLNPETLPLVDGNPRLGPPVGHVGKLVCIGLNYSDHAAELDMPFPDHPVVFLKATSAIIGPKDTVMLPRGATRGDWEIELGIVIGKPASYVTQDEALDHVAGYTIVNDVSERRFQLEMSGQWTKGKSCDTFAPIGPWLVTPDEVGDPQNLAMSLDVNGERMQTGHTSTMIFPVAEIISHLSGLMTLHPGDVIATDTPPGVGMGQSPKRFLASGDEMVLHIERLGTQILPVSQTP